MNKQSLEPQTESPLPDLIEFSVVSICGPAREENQDAALAWRGEIGEVCAVLSDGMGGHSSGREAAEIVVRSCSSSLRERGEEPWSEVLDGAIHSAHESVRAYAAASKAEENGGSMGATAVLAVIDTMAPIPNLHLAHVGDSRAYLSRGRSLIRLTADHSMVGQMVRDGFLTEEQAFGHPDANVLQRAIGQSTPLEAEVQAPVALDRGDVVILCSDGLHGAVRNEVIQDVLGRSSSAGEISEGLVAAALDAHSEDNISVACLKFGDVRETPRRTRGGRDRN